MRFVPRASSTTSPACFSSRRWRETAGRLMGRVSAISRTERSPPPSSSTIARRCGSPSASKGSPAGPALGFGALLEAMDEFVEGGLQIGHLAPHQAEQWSRVLLAHDDRGFTFAARCEREGAFAIE